MWAFISLEHENDGAIFHLYLLITPWITQVMNDITINDIIVLFFLVKYDIIVSRTM